MQTNTVILFSFFFSSFCITYGFQDIGRSKEFRGAVVEYGAKYEFRSSKENVLFNVQSYKDIVEQLKSKFNEMDIIVFPVNGLSLNESDVYAEEIPDPTLNELPCESNYTAALKILSCVAKNNSVYLVVNMVEKSTRNGTSYLYNTNVVLSRHGTVIARYRKYNINGYEKILFHREDTPGISFFDTDFGVRFGTFTCSDVLHKSPALDLVNNYNVTHLAVPHSWDAELPHQTALQVHSGWAHATNTVLMAAGYNDPENGKTGSGIYLGRLPYTAYSFNLSNQSPKKGDFAIVSQIPLSLNVGNNTDNAGIVYFRDKSTLYEKPMKIVKEDLNVYTTSLINDSLVHERFDHRIYMKDLITVNQTICDRDFCCEFYFHMIKMYTNRRWIIPDKTGDQFGRFKYRLAAFNGVRSDGSGTGGIQVCSIISCLNNTLDSCGERTDNGVLRTVVSNSGLKFTQFETLFSDVTIRAKLNSNNSFVTSNILLSNKHLFVRSFGCTVNSSLYDITKYGDADNPSKSLYVLKTRDYIQGPASINLYNRVFDEDDQNAKNIPSGCKTYRRSVILIITSFLFLFLLNKN